MIRYKTSIPGCASRSPYFISHRIEYLSSKTYMLTSIFSCDTYIPGSGYPPQVQVPIFYFLRAPKKHVLKCIIFKCGNSVLGSGQTKSAQILLLISELNFWEQRLSSNTKIQLKQV